MNDLAKAREQAKHHAAAYDRLKTDRDRLATELRELKSERDRIVDALRFEEVRLLVGELGDLARAADPVRGQSLDPASKAADPAPEGAATEWARTGLAQALVEVRRLVRRIQSALRTPVEERIVVDQDGKCVACGKRKGRPRTTSWRAP